jgi:hypothetical protein
MAVTTITKVGAFTDDIATQINDNFTAVGSGGSFASPAITGTVTGGATYTAPVLNTPTVDDAALTGAPTFVGTAATVTDNFNATLAITAATSATRRLVLSAITIDTTGNTFSVSGGGSVAAVRGEQTLAATDTFTDGFLYGVQGKFTMNGTMNETSAARITGVLGQIDLSTGTLTDGQISAVWGDLQGSGPTLTVNDQLYVGRWTNSMATGKKAQAFHLMYGAADLFFEASADGGSADWAVIGAGTYSTADGYLLVNVYGTNYRMPLFIAVD